MNNHYRRECNRVKLSYEAIGTVANFLAMNEGNAAVTIAQIDGERIEISIRRRPATEKKAVQFHHLIPYKTERGFHGYKAPLREGGNGLLLQESSAVGDYHDNTPGSSFLWIGNDYHLNREDVSELVAALQLWLDTKSLNPGGKA